MRVVRYEPKQLCVILRIHLNLRMQELVSRQPNLNAASSTRLGSMSPLQSLGIVIQRASALSIFHHLLFLLLPLLVLLLHIQLTQPTTLFHICHLLYLSATPCSFCPFSFCPTTAPTLLFSASSVRSCTLCVTHSKRRAPPPPHSSGTSVPCFCNITSRSHLLSLLPVDCPDRSKLRIRVVRRCAAARVARRSPPRSFGTQSTRTRLTPRPLDRSRTLNLPESSIPTTTPSPQTTAKRTCQTT